MKVSKLLVMGVLVSVLCINSTTFGAALADDLLADDTEYRIGDTVCYTMSLTALGGDLTNVSCYIYVPTLVGTATCVGVDHAAGGDLIVGPTTLFDGVPLELDCTDLPLVLAYTIQPADYMDADGPSLTAKLGTEATDAGEPDCDQETRTVTILAPEPDTIVTILASDEEVCEGSTVTLTVTEHNQGTTDDTTLTDPYVDLQPLGLTLGWDSTYRVADSPGNNDAVLDPEETWVWEVTGVVVNANTIYTATGHGTDVLGNDVTWCETPGDPPPDTICDQEEQDIVEVLVVDAPDCGITGPDEVCEDDSSVEYCATVAGEGITYAWSITAGDATIDGGVDDQQCVEVTPGTGDFTLSLEICLGDCCNTCDIDVDVIPTPDCSIDSGPRSLCEEDIDIPVEYCAQVVADHYLWEVVSGPATIPGDDDLPCVDVVPTGLGTIVLRLTVCDDVTPTQLDPSLCCNDCTIEIVVEECGQTFCSLTQGAYGNAGGKYCDDRTSTADLIAPCLPITIGVDGRSITFPAGSEDCVIERLPAGGTPMPLPEGLGNFVDDCSPDATDDLVDIGLLKKANKKGARYNNVLIGQVVALTLNVCMSPGCIDGEPGDLAGWTLPDEFCTVAYGQEEPCPIQHYMIPESLVGDSVADLLLAANQMLGGTYVGDASIGDIYTAVTAINEGFDECRTVVPCPVEDCFNDVDDDCDGLIDELDPDCDGIVLF